jgi:hypothetical protein
MKAAIVLLLGALPWLCPAAFAGDHLPPPPDRAAIADLAQRVERGIPYVAGMPARHAECGAVAQPYLDSPGTGPSVAGGHILIACHMAMLVKMAELHYRADAFGPDGMPALLDRLVDDLGRLYLDIYDQPIDCLRNCGSILYQFAAADTGVEFELAVETMALLHVAAPEQERWLKSWNRAGWLK